MIDIFGYFFSVTEFITIVVTLLTIVGGYYKLITKIAQTESKIDGLEKDLLKRAETLESFPEFVNTKIKPLQDQVMIQAQNYAALSATLAGVQPQLVSVSNRLDTIIALMLKEKDR